MKLVFLQNIADEFYLNEMYTKCAICNVYVKKIGVGKVLVRVILVNKKV